MIQIGLRLHDSAETSFRERLINVHDQGFSCVHVALSKIPGLPADREMLTPGYAAWLRHAFEAAGLDIAVLGCYKNLANPNRAVLVDTQKTYEYNIRFAAQLGCGMVGTETGAPNETYTYDKEACHSEEALRTFITNLRPVVKYAESCGVIIAIEPVYKHIVWNPRRARIVLDAIDSPNLQIIFDPVNLLHPDNLDHRDEVIAEAIELLWPDIAMIHLKDYIYKDGAMTSVGCGLGEMNYDSIIRFALEKKPFIEATLENTKPENAEQCRKYIESIEENQAKLLEEKI